MPIDENGGRLWGIFHGGHVMPQNDIRSFGDRGILVIQEEANASEPEIF
jgi:hypothetical protein